MSVLLGTLGSISVMAQSTNVYSLNAVGYINVTIEPGYNIIACPLLAAPDNTVNSVLNNGAGQYNGSTVFFYSPATGYSSDLANTAKTANTNGWTHNGTNVLAPGLACWFLSPFPTNITVTFVGTVPSGPMTNALLAGYNLVSSVLPVSGDIVTNSLSSLTNYNLGDSVITYDPIAGYETYQSSATKGSTGYDNNWTSPHGDPITSNVYSGFWYLNSGATVNWVEDFSVNQ
jgi:hypothetical protein